SGGGSLALAGAVRLPVPEGGGSSTFLRAYHTPRTRACYDGQLLSSVLSVMRRSHRASRRPSSSASYKIHLELKLASQLLGFEPEEKHKRRTHKIQPTVGVSIPTAKLGESTF
ncbi:hypothetical protein THAOC_09617, partial [Thalassiosira oceanica]